MSIGERISELRKGQNLSQGQLADALSITRQAVSKWENNIALPDITLAPLLASYFILISMKRGTGLRITAAHILLLQITRLVM